ncbi:MAG: OmpA family protein [Rhodocyclaceae bacterium]|nr:OmpA family protein [Rhodocyclaceae bacterium]MCP5238798.1 OmpA family protein [Zoogloeaceae bacterium]MCP5254315.1 OmpA family protein [Zoogloeaceae bacterium]
MEDQDQESRFGAIAGVVIALVVALGAVLFAAIGSGGSGGASSAAVETPAVIEVSLGAIRISFADGKMVLEGQVPDENTRRRVLTKAQLFFGIENVTDNLQIVADAPRLWWKAKPLDVFSRLRGLPVFELVLADGDRATLAGRVGSDSAGSEIAAWLSANLVDGLKLENRLEVDAALAGSASQGDPSVLLNETIEFATGSAEVPEAARARLNLIAQVLAEDGRSVKVLGHTDNVGDAESNRVLSRQRAESVAAYLVAHGVDAGKLTADGAGQDKPVADNGTPEGRQRNRRIEFVE